MKTSWSRDIVEEKRQQYQGISLKISSCEKEPFREPSMPMERDPRVTTAQQGSKGLILLEKQTAHLSKTLILHAHEIGTFCIDCTGTPTPALAPPGFFASALQYAPASRSTALKYLRHNCCFRAMPRTSLYEAACLRRVSGANNRLSYHQIEECEGEKGSGMTLAVSKGT